jgi:hypothetical protein
MLAKTLSPRADAARRLTSVRLTRRTLQDALVDTVVIYML